MSCKHCEMDEDGCGRMFYDAPGGMANIQVEDGWYVLCVYSDGHWSRIEDILYCPFCGEELV